jgi:hypothetical protein
LPVRAAVQTTVSELRLRQANLPAYIDHVQFLRSLASACASQASACDPGQVGSDEHVTSASGTSFDAHYAWFSGALLSAKPLPDDRRAALMTAAESHLDADLADVQSGSASTVFSTAHSDADTILSSREFNTVASQPSLRDRIMAWLYRLLARLFGHIATFGSRSPWIGPLLEWILGTVACALLLVWAFRTVRLQRTRMRLDSARQIQQSEERVLNWMHEAEQYAGRERFRDAVHCLYWASIAALEGRRLWQPDRARTPREYLRLLDPASSLAPLLGRQTRSFESIWYGLRPADRADYDHALQLHQQLRSA